MTREVAKAPAVGRSKRARRRHLGYGLEERGPLVPHSVKPGEIDLQSWGIIEPLLVLMAKGREPVNDRS